MIPIKQHDIWYVSFDPSIGQEVQKVRPALVLSDSYYNHHSGTLFVIPLTSQKPPKHMQNLFVKVGATLENGLKVDSYASVSQLRSVSKKRLSKRIGSSEAGVQKKIMKIFLEIMKIDRLDLTYRSGK